MTYHRPLSSEERLEVIEILKRGALSHREIAKRFGRAQSTISAIARGAGISPTHRRTRTAAAKDVEVTYSREERVAIADRALSVLNDLLSSGGLNPRELRETTQALKQTLDARRAEDFPEQDESKKDADQEWVDVGLGDLRVPAGSELAKKFEELPQKLAEEDRAIREGRLPGPTYGSPVKPPDFHYGSSKASAGKKEELDES